MKSIKKTAGILLALITMTAFYSCKEEIEYIPAEQLANAQVYFSNTLPSRIDLSQDMNVNSFVVELYRVITTDAVTVNLKVENESADIFTVPSTAAFTAGSNVARITISYDPQKLGYDTYKSISIAVSDENLITPYGNTAYAFTAGIPAPWRSLGMCTYTDDFVSTFFGISKEPYQVEIQENLVTPGVFRLVNPYGAAYPFNDPGDWDNSKDHYLEINAVDPEGVYIPHPQMSGMDWTYGEFIMSSLAGLRIYRGTSTLEAEKAAGNCGTFENGVITFPQGALVVGMANYPAATPGTMYAANNNGWFQIVMPGTVLADHSVSINYAGRYSDANDNLFAVAEVNLGADVNYAKVALVSGAMTQAALDGIIDGSIESVQINSSGTVQRPCSTAGRYTYVAVTYANDEVQDYGYASFNFTTGSAAATYPIEDFYGDYIMTGLDAWDDSEVNMPVTIAPGSDPNTFTITGIRYAASVKATFPIKGYMSIIPQTLANYGQYDIALYTMTPDGDGSDSETDAMVFTRLESGDLVLTQDSYAIGYYLVSELAGGAVDGYYDIAFTPASSAKVASLRASSMNKAPTSSVLKVKSKDFAKQTKNSKGTFVIQKKSSVKKVLTDQMKLTPLF